MRIKALLTSKNPLLYVGGYFIAHAAPNQIGEYCIMIHVLLSFTSLVQNQAISAADDQFKLHFLLKRTTAKKTITLSSIFLDHPPFALIAYFSCCQFVYRLQVQTAYHFMVIMVRWH